MSSMRNAVQRRNHKERSQPEGRSKWGLLEKHKDYALRAKDHKEKQKKLKVLKEKAALANPDEFSFKMLSSKTKGGIRMGDRGNKALNHDVVKLLKTQDAGYIRTTLQKTRRERERLETEIQLEEGGKFVALKDGEEEVDEWESEDENVQPKRTTFVDSKDDLDRIVDEDSESGEVDDKSTKKLSRSQAAAKRQAEIAAGRALKKKRQQQEVRRKLLEDVRKRENNLALAEQELEIQRAKMGNSIGGVNKNGVTFKIRERKR